MGVAWPRPSRYREPSLRVLLPLRSRGPRLRLLLDAVLTEDDVRKLFATDAVPNADFSRKSTQQGTIFFCDIDSVSVGAPDGVAGVSAVPRGSGANTSDSSRVHFSAREPSPPNGDGGLDANFPAAAARQPSTNAAASFSELTFLHANIRSFGFKSKAKSAEIKRLIERCDFPTFVFFTETWLDKSSQELVIEGYVEVSRRDRLTNTHGGGIAAFAKAGFENTIVHIGNSIVAERSWHVVHSNRGPLLFGLWYRRPDPGEALSVESLEPELAEYGANVLGTILLGDMNVHEESWLRFSDGTSPEG